VKVVAESAYARGAVSGVGLITFLAGIGELGSAFAARQRRRQGQRQGPDGHEPPNG
jgi:hypothetical protein